jgi:hypothetical protein
MPGMQCRRRVQESVLPTVRSGVILEDEMKEFCTVIGEFLITALLFTVPILCTCSIILNWDWHISSLLVILTAVDYILLCEFISANID